MNSGIWILFYMFNYVNFHSICIFFHSWNGFFSKACNQMRWPFFSNWTKDTNSLSRILNKHWPPRRRIHSPLRSGIDSGIGFKLGGVHLIGGRVSSVRKTKRFGGGLCLRKGSWSKKIGRENVVLIIKEPPSQGYHHFRLRMRTLKLEIVRPQWGWRVVRSAGAKERKWSENCIFPKHWGSWPTNNERLIWRIFQLHLFTLKTDVKSSMVMSV